MGNEAWVLSYREECFDQIGLKPSIKIPVYNGSLECEFRKYTIFDGSFKDFREEGGVVKTDDEKKQMAEKHRFKKNREFKKRLDEELQDQGDDIRSYTFKNHFAKTEERNADRKRRFAGAYSEREHRDGRRFDRDTKGSERKDFGRKSGDFGRKGKDFDRNRGFDRKGKNFDYKERGFGKDAKRGEKRSNREFTNLIDHDD